MNIPQQLCRGSDGCVRITAVSENSPANQWSAWNVTVEKKDKEKTGFGNLQLMAPCNSQMQQSLG